MYIFFNKLGKATTILPHGQIVRQGGDLDLYVAMDIDFDPTNKLVEFYYKRPGDKYFSPSGTQLILLNDGNKLEFKKNEDETYTYDLKDGEKYYTYYKHFDSDNPITSIAGTIEIVIRIYKSSKSENSNVYSVNTLDVQGLLKIYVEKTLGYSIETEFFTNPQAQTIPLDMWKNLQDSFADLHENIRCLTEEEVENLWNEVKEEENENPTMNGVKPIAENIKYNNSLSGLAANNVQEAIDKVNEKIGSGSEIDYSKVFKYKEYLSINDNSELDNLETGAYFVEGFTYNGKSYDGTLLNINLGDLLENPSENFYTQILFEGYNYENNNTLNRRIFYRHYDYINGGEKIDWTILSESNPKKDKNFAIPCCFNNKMKISVPKVDLLLTKYENKRSKNILMNRKDIWGSKYGNTLSSGTLIATNSSIPFEVSYKDILYALFGMNNIVESNGRENSEEYLYAFPESVNICDGNNDGNQGTSCKYYYFDIHLDSQFDSMDEFYTYIMNNYDNVYNFLLSHATSEENCDFSNEDGIYKQYSFFRRGLRLPSEPANELTTTGFNYCRPTRLMIKFVKDYEELRNKNYKRYWKGTMGNYWLECQMTAAYWDDGQGISTPDGSSLVQETYTIRYYFRFILHKF